MTKWSKVGIAFAIGFAGGYLLQKSLTKDRLAPEEALKKVKKQINKQINIDGSWIYQHTEEWDGNQVPQKVYRGGITERKGEALKHYDFIVDSETGALLELTPQT
ncbi:PepSY domain-containing protein [Pullulanibacillus sp. KACC 23026]|uniref:PepSY domain-containing protein n=1 Tax=Pullulanibacillus sp. KACC 23026 TaxID=3028315 RepID=UPI0023AF4804|nr:PepSY domain-containing protein [Pullulanibacillus sp. KACC 23026]WEG13861.1 PepSY domain-containing protein [Pullulanibacillus sp. KACC 23026]